MRRIDRKDALPVIGATPAIMILTWWMADDGGYSPAVWMPGLVGLAALFGIVIAFSGQWPRCSRAQIVAIAAFTAYTLWSFGSILWADAPGPALEGSQRTLSYLLCFSLFALLPWTTRALLGLLMLFVFTVTALGLITVFRVTAADDPSRFFIEARLIAPLGYHNAGAALWTSAAIPALMLAARREVIAWLRPTLLGAAGLLFGLALLTQSRGWLFTLPVVLVAAIVLAPGRIRLCLFGGVLAAALGVVLSDLLDVYQSAVAAPAATSAAALAEAFHAAAERLLIAVAGVVVVGALATWIDVRGHRWLGRSPGGRRRVTAVLVAVIATAGVAALLIATDGRPVERADNAWAEFKDFDGRQGEGATNRFSTLGSSRYDFWRVAASSWREHPATGIGQDNFAQPYLERRESDYEEPRWVHSLPLRLLTHTGVGGAMLFGLFAVAAAWAAATRMRQGRDGARVAGGAALVPAVVWLAHGSVDWLWEYPVLSGCALALAGAATGLRTGASAPADRGARAPRVRLRAGLGCVVALACAAVVIPSYIADRDVSQAAAAWPADPEAATERLKRARALNPLNARASLVEGLIATRRGRLEQARASFERAAAREPRDWFARLELGLVAGARGDRRAAITQLQAAQRRNPLDPLIAEALRRARAGAPMGFEEAEAEFALRVARRQGVR